MAAILKWWYENTGAYKIRKINLNKAKYNNMIVNHNQKLPIVIKNPSKSLSLLSTHDFKPVFNMIHSINALDVWLK
jgi:hypothetical protein